MHSPELAVKFRGVLVGAAVGDALGARFEGETAVSSHELSQLDRVPGPLRYTDDTHMTLGEAESLVERRGFDGAHLAALFARKFREEPWRGYGAGPPRVFGLIEQGSRWDQAARSLFDGRGSFGNGAAMRVAPAALFAFRSMDQVVKLATQTAVITHTHDHGIEGAVLQACAVAQALRVSPSCGIQVEAFLDALEARVSAPVYRHKLQRAREMLAISGEVGPEDVVQTLGNGIAAPHSVPTAVYVFLRHSQSFEGVVKHAISVGGDTDTIASMAGALSGTYLGLDAIPPEWRERVEGAAQLQTLADSLLACAGGAEG